MTHTQQNTTIEKPTLTKPLIFEGKKPGPSLLVTASAHGDEKGGSIAIQSIAKQIRSGKREITNGRLVLLPKVNPRAYKEGKRFIDEDINRYMLPGYPRSGYEGKIAVLAASRFPKPRKFRL